AVLGVEFVLLLNRHPGELEPLLLDLLVALSLFGLEFRELVAGRLPFLARSDPVLRHLLVLLQTLLRSAIPTVAPLQTHRGRGSEARGESDMAGAAKRPKRRLQPPQGSVGPERTSTSRRRVFVSRAARPSDPAK